MFWKTYPLSRSKVEVIAPFTMDMHRKKVSAYLRYTNRGLRILHLQMNMSKREMYYLETHTYAEENSAV